MGLFRNFPNKQCEATLKLKRFSSYLPCTVSLKYWFHLSAQIANFFQFGHALSFASNHLLQSVYIKPFPYSFNLTLSLNRISRRIIGGSD